MSKWSVDQETMLFKSISRLKPTGPHKHFRMIGIRSMVNSRNLKKDKGITAKQIWDKLAGLYELASLDEIDNTVLSLKSELQDSEDVDVDGTATNLEDSDDDQTNEEKFEEFLLPWTEYWQLMEAQAEEKESIAQGRKVGKVEAVDVELEPESADGEEEKVQNEVIKNEAEEDNDNQKEEEEDEESNSGANNDKLEDGEVSTPTPTAASTAVHSRKRARDEEDSKSESETDVKAARKTRRSTRFAAASTTNTNPTFTVAAANTTQGATPKTKGKSRAAPSHASPVEEEPAEIEKTEKTEKNDKVEKNEKEEASVAGTRSTRRQTMTKTAQAQAQTQTQTQSTRRSSRRK